MISATTAKGSGDDTLYQSSPSDTPTNSDGHKDYIDCGPGNDNAYINTSVDGDIAYNCEHLFTG